MVNSSIDARHRRESPKERLAGATMYRAAPSCQSLLDKRWHVGRLSIQHRLACVENGTRRCKTMPLLMSERPRDGIGGCEWMRARFALHMMDWGERAGGTINMRGLCVVIRGAFSVVIL